MKNVTLKQRPTRTCFCWLVTTNKFEGYWTQFFFCDTLRFPQLQMVEHCWPIWVAAPQFSQPKIFCRYFQNKKSVKYHPSGKVGYFPSVLFSPEPFDFSFLPRHINCQSHWLQLSPEDKVLSLLSSPNTHQNLNSSTCASVSFTFLPQSLLHLRRSQCQLGRRWCQKTVFRIPSSLETFFMHPLNKPKMVTVLCSLPLHNLLLSKSSVTATLHEAARHVPGLVNFILGQKIKKIQKRRNFFNSSVCNLNFL